MSKIRRMASEFQGQFQEAMREAEMADLKKQFDETTSGIQSALDPTGFKTDLEKMIQDPMIQDPVNKDPMASTVADAASATSTPATPPSDPTAPIATPATSTPEQTPPTDPVALGTAPVSPAPLADISVPMPDLPPPVETKDFADAAPSSPAPKPEGGKAA